MAKNNSLYNFTILHNSFATSDHKVQIWTKENKTKQFFYELLRIYHVSIEKWKLIMNQWDWD